MVARVAVSVAFLLCASAAEAQPEVFTGLLTGHVGPATGGDVRDWTVMPGVSMAVIDESGLGVEVEAGYAGGFDNSQFVDSSIATVMVNVMAIYPHERLRPFFAVGAGVMRVRAVLLPGQTSTTDTDGGWNAGGGVLYMLNEALGFRGDIRYFRQFGRQQELPLGDNDALNFIRSSVGVTYSWPMR